MLCVPVLVASSLVTPSSVVRVKDAASRRPVLLVGTMHYNPHSIAIVQGAVQAAARQHGLHATAIELCPSRWNSSAAASWREKRDRRIPSYERLGLGLGLGLELGLGLGLLTWLGRASEF